ncbi:nuclear transport factor 2 family protein [Salegentibacter salegens]|uniref:Ketosteroid isomerase-related protein n=1 Tax=Salegentibacter salegens TaxID=143223 RepID=A0A1M7K7E4_9FLAO|nr:nuclear transport factor 2 family protein [Salegentibacter salegens]PRX43147.1 ketosteroid isomerase-like protein [Salegentibacter salegens]SHM61176.1 Ketosteroid isomerase-related protein [Salegentibacter salegens]
MKTLKNQAIFLAVFFVTITTFGQEYEESQKIDYKTGNPANWPAELDAVIAAPNNHKILLENDQVRVLEVYLAPEEKEPLHHHKWPSVLYIQEAGDFIDYDSNDSVIFDTQKLPEPLSFPLTMNKEPEAPHSVVNLSKTKPLRLIRVEMKPESTNQNTGIIEGLYNSFAQGDIPSVLEAMDEEIIWNEAEGNAYADGNPYIGPEAILNGVLARIGAEHEYFKLEDIKLHETNNNQIMATLRYDAKVKETGKTYNAQVAHLWTLKDGKVSAFQQYVDTKKINDAMSK